MRHVHLFDPQLHGQGGHYMNHDAQLVRELQRRDIPVSVYARRGCEVQCAGVTPRHIFTNDIFQEASSDPQVWPIENFHNINQVFLTDLCQIALDQFTADDLIYLPNLLQNQLYALATWLGRIPVQRRPAVAVMLRYLNHAMDYVQARANKELIALYYRYAARAVRGVQPRTLICTDTRELAVAYQQIIGFPMVELPNPMDVSDLLVNATSRAPSAPPVVVYQGHTSPLRGFHFLPDIIERCLTLQPKPRFVVHVQHREAATKGQMENLIRLAATGDVRLVYGSLLPADYFGILAEADIVLLPYSPTFYGYGSSGVFTEAASVGKVVVVSAKTVPARLGKEFKLGVVIAQQWDAPSMANAVASALRDLPALRAKAQAGAACFRTENCAQTLWDRVFTAIQALPAAPSTAAAA